MSSRSVVILLLSVGFCLGGCEQRDDSGSKTQEADEAAAEGGGPIASGEFEGALVEGICGAYEECKNADFQVAIYSVFLQSLASENPEDDEIAGLMQEMETQHIPSKENCMTVFTRVVGEFGMSEEVLQAKISEGRLEYDEDAAGDCISQFGRPFDLCAEERPLSDEMKARDFRAMMSRHQANMDAHFQVCGDILRGKVEAGGECEESYECVEGQRCGEAEDGSMICMAAPSGSGGLLP